MTSQLASRLAAIVAVPDQKLRADEYRAVLAEVVALASVDLCKHFVEHSGCFLCIRAAMQPSSRA